ncbi:MAG: hypothetical protein HGA61_00405 [Candidatus Moranbacteria bacterium]|nr:hypothetical protein [Candidatus Moranbacteria bacterium]
MDNEYVELKNLEQYIGQQVRISGIVEEIEDHGGILFLNIRDLEFFIRALVIPDKERAFSVAKNIKRGYLVDLLGLVKKSPLSSNDFLCEIEVETLAIISARTRVANIIKIAESE